MQPRMADIVCRLDAAEVIGEHVALRQSGRTLKGLCPFHPEKTPSFHVNRERGLWHCFGCGAGGDLAAFIMKIQNLSFPETLELLARKAGISLSPPSDPQYRKRRRIREMMELASAFYRQMLAKSKPGEHGLAYLTSRGIGEKTIEKFHLGMAPSGRQGLLNHLAERNYSPAEMRDAGLVSRADPPRDCFCNRLIFPIWDSGGDVIAFGGRSLGDEQPKYLNSPETPFFKKGENLYAFHLAKPRMIKEGFVFLAEGYLDVMALHQFGFDHAVATLGTSLTSGQIRMLSRLVPRIAMAYDGDRAGSEAMNRALTLIQGSGVEIRFIAFPENEDPDSFLHKNGGEALQKLLDQSLSPVDFLMRRMKSRVDSGSPEGKKKIVEELSPFLRSLSDPILTDAYLKKVSQALDLSEAAVRKFLGLKIQTPLSLSEAAGLPSRESEILSWLLWEPGLGSTVWPSLAVEDFEDSACRGAAEVLHRMWSEEKKSLSEVEGIPEEALVVLSRLANRPPSGEARHVKGLVEAQKVRRAKRELSLLKKQISGGLKEGKVESTDEAYRKYISLLQTLKRPQERG